MQTEKRHSKCYSEICVLKYIRHNELFQFSGGHEEFTQMKTQASCLFSSCFAILRILLDMALKKKQWLLKLLRGGTQFLYIRILNV